jgi:hypothetical protein
MGVLMHLKQINVRNIFHSFPSQNPCMIKCVQEKNSSPCAHYDGVWERTNVVPLILNLGTKRGESTTSPGKQPNTERIQAILWHEIQLRARLTLPREPWEAVALETKIVRPQFNLDRAHIKNFTTSYKQNGNKITQPHIFLNIYFQLPELLWSKVTMARTQHEWNSDNKQLKKSAANLPLTVYDGRTINLFFAA